MKKIIITSEMVNLIAEEEIIRTHERRAKAHAKRERKKDLIAQGIDPEIAAVMASTFTEYGI